MRNKKSAFSLIELSIVILIIGLIIAGVIGGRKLINLSSLSKARALTNSSPVNGIEDLVMWYETTSKSSFPTNLSDGNNVITWNDINPQLTGKNNVTQATPANQPIYVENAINGLPGIRFTSTSNNQRLQLTDSSFAGKNEFTVFTVLKYTSVNASSSQFLVITSTSGALSDYVFGMSGVANPVYFSSSMWNPSLPGSVGTLTASTSATPGQSYIVTSSYNPSLNESKSYINGEQAADATAPYSTQYSNTTITIGNYTDQPRTFGGDIGEIIIFNRALPDFERSQVESYLSKKWGIKLI